ncbi:MAG: helix-turn-helix domain-containing protein, partial [Lachnospiraceae bacterium]|nr:helix-turn-helix domain-containing protein [Lachnospiraceae bacterium]
YSAYNGRSDGITDTSFAPNMIGGMDKLLEFFSVNNDDSAMDISSDSYRLGDDEVKKIMFSLTGCKTVSDYQKLSDDEQKSVILKLHKNRLSLAQIGRLTGKTRNMVYRIVKQG